MSILERLPHANVQQMEFGRSMIDNLGSQWGRYVVTTMPIPWNLVKTRSLKQLQVIDVQDMDLEPAIAIEKAIDAIQL